jgi:hypothetical protein
VLGRSSQTATPSGVARLGIRRLQVCWMHNTCERARTTPTHAGMTVLGSTSAHASSATHVCLYVMYVMYVMYDALLLMMISGIHRRADARPVHGWRAGARSVGAAAAVVAAVPRGVDGGMLAVCLLIAPA